MCVSPVCLDLAFHPRSLAQLPATAQRYKYSTIAVPQRTPAVNITFFQCNHMQAKDQHSVLWINVLPGGELSSQSRKSPSYIPPSLLTSPQHFCKCLCERVEPHLILADCLRPRVCLACRVWPAQPCWWRSSPRRWSWTKGRNMCTSSCWTFRSQKG